MGGYRKKSKSGFKTKTEAKTWAVKTEGSKYQGEINFSSSQSFVQYFEEWVATYKQDVTRSTKYGYLNTIMVLKNNFGSIELEQITRQIAQRFLNDYGKTHSIGSSLKLRGHINSSLRDAVSDGIIRSNPFDRTKVSGRAAKDSSLKYLEAEDFKKLVKYLINHHSVTHDIMLVGALTGARLGEIIALCPTDVDDGLIHISKTFEGCLKVSKEPKTPNSIRDIDVPVWLTDYLKSIRNGNERFFKRNQSSVNRELGRTLKRLGIDKQIPFHGLRHTHASYLITQGIATEYISERLGHANIGITQSTYLHLLNVKRDSEIGKTISYLENIDE